MEPFHADLPLRPLAIARINGKASQIALFGMATSRRCLCW
jgi:hypothetical protein